MLLLLAASHSAHAATDAAAFDATPMLVPVDAAAVAANCDIHLAHAATLRSAFEADNAAPSLATRVAFDRIAEVLDAAAGDAGLIAATSPDAARRDAARACGAQAQVGGLRLSTDYPDLYPVLNYARSADLRQRLFIVNRTRAWPQNDAVLRELLAGRDALAKLLGRPDYTTLMLGTRT